jgi:hypothetical protein
LEDTCSDLWLAWRLSRKPSLSARFDDSSDVSDKKRSPIESSRIRIERDPGKKSGPSVDDNPVGRAEEPPDVKKVWDPWAEDEPVFGKRERQHALSRHPGTPPCGNLAVQDPTSAGGSAPRELSALASLDKPLRVELELGASGPWTFGLVERASRTGFEMRLDGNQTGTRDLVQAGRKIKVLVAPHGDVAFVLQARVLWISPSSSPDSPMRAQLALITESASVLSRWVKAIEKARC